MRMTLWRRFKPVALALIVPLLLLGFWQVATTNRWTQLIPTPYQVAEYMVDFGWGGRYDDAYSATLVTHLLASMSRVYGGFALAALFALPIGLMIGRARKKNNNTGNMIRNNKSKSCSSCIRFRLR